MKKCGLPPCRAQGEDREDVHIVQIRRPSFWPIYFKMCPYNFNGAFPPCSYMSVGVTRTCFVDL